MIIQWLYEVLHPVPPTPSAINQYTTEVIIPWGLQHERSGFFVGHCQVSLDTKPQYRPFDVQTMVMKTETPHPRDVLYLGEPENYPKYTSRVIGVAESEMVITSHDKTNVYFYKDIGDARTAWTNEIFKQKTDGSFHGFDKKIANWNLRKVRNRTATITECTDVAESHSIHNSQRVLFLCTVQGNCRSARCPQKKALFATSRLSQAPSEGQEITDFNATKLNDLKDILGVHDKGEAYFLLFFTDSTVWQIRGNRRPAIQVMLVRNISTTSYST